MNLGSFKGGSLNRELNSVIVEITIQVDVETDNIIGCIRIQRRVSFLFIQAVKSDKLQPTPGGLIKTVKRCASN